MGNSIVALSEIEVSSIDFVEKYIMLVRERTWHLDGHDVFTPEEQIRFF